MGASVKAYVDFCQQLNLTPAEGLLAYESCVSLDSLSQLGHPERITAGLSVLLSSLTHEPYSDELDLLDAITYTIGKLDRLVSDQVNEALHHPKFQQLESAWRGLKFLVDRTDFSANIKIECLNVSKEKLQQDFQDATDISQAGLHQHLYVQEYDTPGGEPISVMITDYYFSAEQSDLTLLSDLSKTAAKAHCPVIAGGSPALFGKSSFSEVCRLSGLSEHMKRADFIRWNSLRQTEEARYLGLALPRFLLRNPYQEGDATSLFQFREDVVGNPENYLWGNASFAFAANLVNAFKEYGWTVNVRGPRAGGEITNLPVPTALLQGNPHTTIPTELIIAETLELELSALGFIPLSYYKNSNKACFFSANSIQQVKTFSDPRLTASYHINARLPYVLLVCRLAHYLKIIQRENIGSMKSQQALALELNNWLKSLITKMDHPEPNIAAQFPLRDGEVRVFANEENPGYYRVELSVMPHLQIEGMDVQLSLVSSLPTN